MNQFRINIIILCCILFFEAKAQFNAQAGFCIGYTQYDVLSKITNTYDGLVMDSIQSKDFGTTNVDKGLWMGARFQSQYVGILGGFHFYINDMFNKQINPQQVAKKVVASAKNRRVVYSVAGEIYVDRLTLGAAYEYNILNLKWKSPQDSKSSLVGTGNFWSNRFYIGFEIPYDDYHAVVIQPYIQLPYREYDFRPLAEKMLPPDYIDPSPDYYKEKSPTYGISFFFCNGEQRY